MMKKDDLKKKGIEYGNPDTSRAEFLKNNKDMFKKKDNKNKKEK